MRLVRGRGIVRKYSICLTMSFHLLGTNYHLCFIFLYYFKIVLLESIL